MLDREFSGIVIEILILLSGDTKKKEFSQKFPGGYSDRQIPKEKNGRVGGYNNGDVRIITRKMLT